MLIQGLDFVGNVGKLDITLPVREAWHIRGKVCILNIFLTDFMEILEMLPLGRKQNVIGRILFMFYGKLCGC